MESIIIELIDGKFRFNKNNLLSSLEKLNENQGFAVIPIIGENTEFLDDYLNNDLKRDSNSNWLVKNSTIELLIRKYSLKTSVLMFESRIPLQYSCEKRMSQYVRDINKMFLRLSSTLMLICDKTIKTEDIIIFDQKYRQNDDIKPFNNLLIVVTDWDPKAPGIENKNYSLGSIGGDRYLRKEFNISNLEECFKKFTCYLLPQKHAEKYSYYVERLSKNHLLNFTDIEVMKDPQDFIISCENFVETLNDRLLNNRDYVADILPICSAQSHTEFKPILTKQNQDSLGKSEIHTYRRDDQGCSSNRANKPGGIFEDFIKKYDEEIQNMVDNSLLENLSWSSFKAIDIEVSSKCKYLFETMHKSSKAIEMLSDKLNKKKQDYFKEIQVIIKYRDEWLKELEQNIFIEPNILNAFNGMINENINIPNNMSIFVQNNLKTIFKAVEQENDHIIENEKAIAKGVINKIVEKFESRLKTKINSESYDKDQFEMFFKKLADYSMNSLKKNFDYKSNENSFLIQYENQLNAIFLSRKEQIYSDYKKHKNLAQYRSVQNDIKQNDHLDEKTYQSNSDNSTFDQTKVLAYQTPSSILIMFGKANNFFICMNNNSFEALGAVDNQLLTKVNCIHLSGNVLIGQEAKKDQAENFDVKDLLFIRHFEGKKREELYKQFPFHFTNENKIYYREIETNLNIESLIALQVLDIKSETKNNFNTNVTNAVFIVPTNYTIRQFEDFRNIGILSGFKEHHIKIFTQINCAAIGFAEKMRQYGQNYIKNVLFISMNGYECDSTVCEINDYNINYKSFLYTNLNTAVKKKYGPSILKNEDLVNKMMTIFKDSIEQTLRFAFIHRNILDCLVLSGTSLLFPEISEHISKNFTFKIDWDYDPVDIIMYGSQYNIKSLMINDDKKIYKITELIKYCTKYSLKPANKSVHGQSVLICHTNTIKLECLIHDYERYMNEFPIEIKFYQDDFMIGYYSIEKPEQVQFEKCIHYIEFCVFNDEQKLHIKSWIDYAEKYRSVMNVFEIMDLGQSDIEEQKRIIKNIHL